MNYSILQAGVEKLLIFDLADNTTVFQNVGIENAGMVVMSNKEIIEELKEVVQGMKEDMEDMLKTLNDKELRASIDGRKNAYDIVLSLLDMAMSEMQ